MSLHLFERQACRRSRSCDLLAPVHKDKPPSPFDIAHRPLRYVVWLGLGTGFVLSVLVNLAYLLAKDNAIKGKAPWSPAVQKAVPEKESPK